MRRHASAILLVFLGLACAWSPRASAEPRPWGVAFDALFAGDYLDEVGGFPSALMPVVGVQRPVNRTLWLRSELGYKDVGYPRYHSRTAPLSVGVRWADIASNGFGAYLDFYPTLFAYAFDGELPGNHSADLSSSDRRVRRLVPGLVTGFGLQFQANRSVFMSYGIRIDRSAQVDEVIGALNQVGFQIGVDWRPPFDEHWLPK